MTSTICLIVAVASAACSLPFRVRRRERNPENIHTDIWKSEEVSELSDRESSLHVEEEENEIDKVFYKNAAFEIHPTDSDALVSQDKSVVEDDGILQKPSAFATYRPSIDKKDEERNAIWDDVKHDDMTALDWGSFYEDVSITSSRCSPSVNPLYLNMSSGDMDLNPLMGLRVPLRRMGSAFSSGLSGSRYFDSIHRDLDRFHSISHSSLSSELSSETLYAIKQQYKIKQINSIVGHFRSIKASAFQFGLDSTQQFSTRSLTLSLSHCQPDIEDQEEPSLFVIEPSLSCPGVMTNFATEDLITHPQQNSINLTKQSPQLASHALALSNTREESESETVMIFSETEGEEDIHMRCPQWGDTQDINNTAVAVNLVPQSEVALLDNPVYGMTVKKREIPTVGMTLEEYTTGRQMNDGNRTRLRRRRNEINDRKNELLELSPLIERYLIDGVIDNLVRNPAAMEHPALSYGWRSPSDYEN